MIRILTSLVALTFTSCGLLGLTTDTTNYDPEFQAAALAEINKKRIAIEMDSLLREIDLANLAIPENIDQTTLIVEVYSYEDYLKIPAHRFSDPQKDTEKQRKHYNRYIKEKESLIKNPKYKVAYRYETEYRLLDVKEYRYVLKTSNRLDWDPNHIIVTSDGGAYPWMATVMYYIYDRETGAVFREIKDLSMLSIERKSIR